MLKNIAAFTFAVALGLPALAKANTVESRVEIMQTGVPASIPDPPCADEVNDLPATTVLNGIAGSIDYAAGIPVGSALLATQPPGNKEWLLQRIGVPRNGPSFCATLCAPAPANVTASAKACYSETGGDGQECFAGDSGVRQFFSVVNFSKALRGDAQLICATGKNWSHNRNRWFWLKVDY